MLIGVTQPTLNSDPILAFVVANENIYIYKKNRYIYIKKRKKKEKEFLSTTPNVFVM